MDYADDRCMVLFTKEQVARMEATLNTSPDRRTLITSNGCTPVTLSNRDLRPTRFTEPHTSICDPNNVRPVIEIYNAGADTIKFFTVNYTINGGALNTISFTSSLPFNQTAAVPLLASNFSLGTNTIKLYTLLPNGQVDQQPMNDTISYSFRVLTPLNNSLAEGFEGPFPPLDWEITQTPVDAITWRKTTQAGRNSTSSVYIDNYNYAAAGRIDDLITPAITYTGADSVFFKFDVAAAVYSFPGSSSIPLDTLEVLASTDCGRTFSSIYKKWGAQLQTLGDPNSGFTNEFFPRSNSEWRTDSINLSSLLGNTNTVRFAFKNTTNNENNIFIDNVNFYIKVLPARLKNTGLLISPNPFRNRFSIQHYLPPTDLKGFSIYNSVGQLVLSRTFSAGMAQSYIEVDLSQFSNGIYIVHLIYADRKVSQKVVKVN